MEELDTIVAVLREVLDRHLTSRTSLTVPYLHPYPPGKGKQKAVNRGSTDLPDLGAVKAAIQALRPLLSNGVDAKLLNALREGLSNEVLPLSNAQISLTLDPAPAFLPALSTPVEVLKATATRIGLQVYTEDSQFGLLKTSLALAGETFVIDVDLELDAVSGNEEDDEMDQEAHNEGEGRFRLAKLTVNHVHGQATGRSSWVEKVLRQRIEAYLEAWNEILGAASSNNVYNVQARMVELEHELSDLLAMDKADPTVDWFEDLEKISVEVEKMISGDGPILLSSEGSLSIFPSFSLVPPLDERKYTFHVRPLNTYDSALTSPTISNTSWLNGRWILEHEGKGLVVRRDWLHDVPAEEQISWENFIRVESLSYGSDFPHGSEFTHATQGTPQKWVMLDPGPRGFVVGRLPIGGKNELVDILEKLRAQAVLDRIFSSAFNLESLSATVANDADELDDELTLLTGAGAIPVTVRLGARNVHVSFPLAADSNATPPTLSLIVSPTPNPPNFMDVKIQVEGSVDADQLSRWEASLEEIKLVGGHSLMDLIGHIARTNAA